MGLAGDEASLCIVASGGTMFCTGRLQAIKVLHTAAWTVFASAIVALPVAAWRGEFHVAVRLIALISLELMVLAANRGRCPLTAVAARHTTERQPNFDIYLPVWLARWNKTIFGAILIGGLLLTLALWLQQSGSR